MLLRGFWRIGSPVRTARSGTRTPPGDLLRSVPSSCDEAAVSGEVPHPAGGEGVDEGLDRLQHLEIGYADYAPVEADGCGEAPVDERIGDALQGDEGCDVVDQRLTGLGLAQGLVHLRAG